MFTDTKFWIYPKFDYLCPRFEFFDKSDSAFCRLNFVRVWVNIIFHLCNVRPNGAPRFLCYTNPIMLSQTSINL